MHTFIAKLCQQRLPPRFHNHLQTTTSSSKRPSGGVACVPLQVAADHALCDNAQADLVDCSIGRGHDQNAPSWEHYAGSWCAGSTNELARVQKSANYTQNCVALASAWWTLQQCHTAGQECVQYSLLPIRQQHNITHRNVAPSSFETTPDIAKAYTTLETNRQELLISPGVAVR